MGDIFGVSKISNIFWGAQNSWYFFGWTVDAGPEPTYTEKIRVGLPRVIIEIKIKITIILT